MGIAEDVSDAIAVAMWQGATAGLDDADDSGEERLTRAGGGWLASRSYERNGSGGGWITLGMDVFRPLWSGYARYGLGARWTVFVAITNRN